MFKFVFENSSFEIADAYQSLLGTCFAAVAINRSRMFADVPAWRWWCRRYFYEIDRKSGTSTLVVSMLLHWYCQTAFCRECMIKFALKILKISGVVTACFYIGPGHLTQSMRPEVYITLWVIPKVQTFRSILHTGSLVTRSVTDNCHDTMCPIYWALVALHNAERH